MKKTVNINLAGYPFIIDEDAFNLLKDYIDTIRFAFETEVDTNEIASDIEARIAEIIYEKEPRGNRIITIEEISSIIARIGKPEEIIEMDENVTRNSKGNSRAETEEIKVEEPATPPPYYPPYSGSNNYLKKKLFRDPDDSLLGGVCSGLAAYLKIDPTWVRLITILLFFLSGTTVAIVYIILWIVLPEARTPLQKMQMMGENPTIENIGRTVTENYNETTYGSAYQSQNGSQKNIFSKILSVFVKIIVGLCLITGILFLLAFIPVLIICIIAFFAAGTAAGTEGIFGEPFNLSPDGGGLWPLYLLLATIGGLITIGIPVYLLIRMAFKKKPSPQSAGNRKALLCVWLIGIALLAVFTVKTVKLTKYLQKEYNIFHIENSESLTVEKDSLENISINEEGIKIQNKNGKTITIDEEGIKATFPQETKTNQVITDTISKSEILTDSIK